MNRMPRAGKGRENAIRKLSSQWQQEIDGEACESLGGWAEGGGRQCLSQKICLGGQEMLLFIDWLSVCFFGWQKKAPGIWGTMGQRGQYGSKYLFTTPRGFLSGVTPVHENNNTVNNTTILFNSDWKVGKQIKYGPKVDFICIFGYVTADYTGKWCI